MFMKNEPQTPSPRITQKISVALLSSLCLIVQISDFAYANDVVDVVQENYIQDTQTQTKEETLGGKVTVIQEWSKVNGTDYKAVEADITPENLTVLLSGLNDRNKEETMSIIDKYIDAVVNKKEYNYVYVTGNSFVDAEKFSAQTPGYDSQHCWAATAANILWTTGYAQQTVNPQTGKKFINEDEVLTYFSDNFTDYPGSPDEGIDWFMKGASAYSKPQSMAGVAHYKDSNAGGLLPNEIISNYTIDVWDNPEKSMTSLLSIGAQGMGVLVKWLDANGEFLPSGHWMTVVGVVIDKTKNQTMEAYKALILADSDNDSVYPTSVNLDLTTSEQKLAEKEKCKNKYTLYNLIFDPNLGDKDANGNRKGGFYLSGFAGSNNAVISYLYALLDSNKSPEGDEDDNSIDIKNLLNGPFQYHNSSNSIGIELMGDLYQYDNNKIIVSDDETETVITIDDIFGGMSEKMLDRGETLDYLNEYMTSKGIMIFSRSDGVVSLEKSDDYVAYFKTQSIPQILVAIDGTLLLPDAYDIVVLSNGMSKIRIKNSYLKALSYGKHNLQINAMGSKVAITDSINVTK